ncbi:hypothetical protein TrRE_jg3502 [Triparma retinervis]|uniref:Uncharacterized protein n=1 Tax=Triparma retinervis TaxID=2557542 RepID=A0A9W7DWS5_9STRA|nr:hypothetical protein TrRE_jg3502 [Triparma retinervis]
MVDWNLSFGLPPPFSWATFKLWTAIPSELLVCFYCPTLCWFSGILLTDKMLSLPRTILTFTLQRHPDKRPLLKRQPLKYPETVFDTQMREGPYTDIDRPLSPASEEMLVSRFSRCLAESSCEKEAYLKLSSMTGYSIGRVKAVVHLSRLEDDLRLSSPDLVHDDLHEHVWKGIEETLMDAAHEGVRVREINDFREADVELQGYNPGISVSDPLGDGTERGMMEEERKREDSARRRDEEEARERRAAEERESRVEPDEGRDVEVGGRIETVIERAREAGREGMSKRWMYAVKDISKVKVEASEKAAREKEKGKRESKRSRMVRDVAVVDFRDGKERVGKAKWRESKEMTWGGKKGRGRLWRRGGAPPREGAQRSGSSKLVFSPLFSPATASTTIGCTPARVVAGETSVNLDSQWAYDDACLLRESLAGEEEGEEERRRRGVRWGKEVGEKTPGPRGAAVGGGKVTPGTGERGTLKEAGEDKGAWEGDLSEQLMMMAGEEKIKTGKDEAGGHCGGTIRTKGQKEDGVASSLEWSNKKRVCAEGK